VNWRETQPERVRASFEQPVVIRGPHGKLFGIVTPPAPEAVASKLCAILLGRNRWWGDRLSVKAARWLAARGFACLRFDYHGYGESEGECKVIDPDGPYSEDALAAIRFMRDEYGQERFALNGFCFDGRTAMSVVEDEGDSIAAIVVAAALPGEMASLNTHPEKAGRGISDASSVVRVSENFKRAIKAVAASNVRCLLLYGSDDIEYQNFKLAEATLLTTLAPTERERITIEVWPGKVHIAEDPDRMREVTARALAWIDEFRQTPSVRCRPGVINGLRS